ncbi:NAD(P)-dependent oxidoreductase, partial [Pseudomonas syringae pv. tagetis]
MILGCDDVCHSAAKSTPSASKVDFDEANDVATQMLAVASGDCGVWRLVHFSSPAIYFVFQIHVCFDEQYRA